MPRGRTSVSSKELNLKLDSLENNVFPNLRSRVGGWYEDFDDVSFLTITYKRYNKQGSKLRGRGDNLLSLIHPFLGRMYDFHNSEYPYYYEYLQITKKLFNELISNNFNTDITLNGKRVQKRLYSKLFFEEFTFEEWLKFLKVEKRKSTKERQFKYLANPLFLVNGDIKFNFLFFGFPMDLQDSDWRRLIGEDVYYNFYYRDIETMDDMIECVVKQCRGRVEDKPYNLAKIKSKKDLLFKCQKYIECPAVNNVYYSHTRDSSGKKLRDYFSSK